MGMDVFGLKPTSSVGEYFRNNVWYWRPLWDYCCTLDETLYERVPDAHNNSGDGLDASGARQLAFRLEKEIASGRASEFVEAYENQRNSLEKIPCSYCSEDQDTSQLATQKVCHSCNVTKLVDSYSFYYSMSIENIVRFKNFLMDCGGFQIC